MRYIKDILKKNSIWVLVYIGLGIFNSFVTNYKVDYFQRVIDGWSYVKKKYKLNVTNFPFFVIVNSLSLLGPFPSFSDIVPHIHLETNIHNDYEYGLYYRMFQYIQKLVYMHECS